MPECFFAQEGADYVVDDTTGCWLWLGVVGTCGYGHVWHDGRLQSAYRVAYVDAFGPVPEGYHVHHDCETPLCINPDHLLVMTPRAHQRLHGRGKLSYEIAEEIRERWHNGESMNSMAIEYEVSPGTVSNIIKGKSYARP